MTATYRPTPQVPALDGMTPLGITPIPVKVEMWVTDLCEALEKSYERRYPNSSSKKIFRCEAGRKYWKIVGYDEEGDVRRSEGVHAFVDKKTGEVYKPASWRGPAKGVRYDLRIIRERQECFARADWAGGYLYVR